MSEEGWVIRFCCQRVPGWRADVPLPVDPDWKKDYAASVQRLVRDGVDTPLANRFVHASRAVPPNAEGANRARSATEAFLYRCLETLSETAGRFHLNAELPIAFDGWGRMEVDLLCPDLRIVVEEEMRKKRCQDESLDGWPRFFEPGGTIASGHEVRLIARRHVPIESSPQV